MVSGRLNGRECRDCQLDYIVADIKYMSRGYAHRAVEVGGVEPPRHELTISAPHPLPPQQ